MKKFYVLFAAILVLSLAGFGAGTATAAPPIDRHELNASACGGGTLVVNITHDVVNDKDSALGGTFWANDAYNRHIQVWQTGENTFCVLVDYVGSFVTYEGPSPQGTDPSIAAGITGNMNGGYRATIAGSLNLSPATPATGNIGSYDYAVDAPFNWLGTYFTNSTFTYSWWGWTYRTASNGTWVNVLTGNTGDITD